MKPIPISQVDALFANGRYPIEFLLYYPRPVKTKHIRSSLRQLSASFWPVFGRYHHGQIEPLRYREAVFFEEKTLSTSFNPLAPAEEIFDKYKDFNPAHIETLFFVTVIQYRNGTLLIPKMNHLVGDGYSYFYFLSALAALSQPTYIPFKKRLIRYALKPSLKRTVLKDFLFDATPLVSTDNKTSYQIQFDRISRKEVKAIIRDLSDPEKESVSSNDILSAIVMQKTAGLTKSGVNEEFYLTIPVDIRRQLGMYGPKYFGNGLYFNRTRFVAEEMARMDLVDIARKIRNSMVEISTDSYLNYLVSWEDLINNGQLHQLRPFDPDTGCLVTNLSRMPANRLNFGSGYPDYIFPLTIEKNSAAVLADKTDFILRLAY